MPGTSYTCPSPGVARILDATPGQETNIHFEWVAVPVILSGTLLLMRRGRAEAQLDGSNAR
jgi:hypothetical protein